MYLFAIYVLYFNNIDYICGMNLKIFDYGR